MARILPVPYFPQQADGYCLAACVQMVLAHLGLTRSQDDLARELDLRPGLGVRATNILRVSLPDIEVLYRWGDWSELTDWLAQGAPAIAFVETRELPYWQGRRAAHAVVVVGSDDATTWLLDPAFRAEPQQVSRGDFLLAWDEMDGAYGILRRRT